MARGRRVSCAAHSKDWFTGRCLEIRFPPSQHGPARPAFGHRSPCRKWSLFLYFSQPDAALTVPVRDCPKWRLHHLEVSSSTRKASQVGRLVKSTMALTISNGQALLYWGSGLSPIRSIAEADRSNTRPECPHRAVRAQKRRACQLRRIARCWVVAGRLLLPVLLSDNVAAPRRRRGHV